MAWAIAKHCGVSFGLVQKLYKELSAHDEQMRKPAWREVERGGTTFEMDTARIGRWIACSRTRNGAGGQM
jgi:hypothetical protein